MDATLRAIVCAMGAMRGALRRRGVAPEDLDDVLQECAIAAWEQAARGNLVVPPDEQEAAHTLNGFFVIVARRVCSRRWGKSAPHEARVDLPVVPLPSVEDAAMAREAMRTLEQATTPERWRALVAVAEGATAPELGRLDRVSVNTVYTRLFLGRRDVEAARRRGWC